MDKLALIIAAEAWLLEENFVDDDLLAHCLDNAEDACQMITQAQRVIEGLLTIIKNNSK